MKMPQMMFEVSSTHPLDDDYLVINWASYFSFQWKGKTFVRENTFTRKTVVKASNHRKYGKFICGDFYKGFGLSLKECHVLYYDLSRVWECATFFNFEAKAISQLYVENYFDLERPKGWPYEPTNYETLECPSSTVWPTPISDRHGVTHAIDLGTYRSSTDWPLIEVVQTEADNQEFTERFVNLLRETLSKWD